MAACTATFTACNNEESLPTAGNQLNLSFGIKAPQSRAIFTDTKLPDGKPVGVRLDGYADYANLVYTGSTTSGTQSWTSTTSVTLTDTKGTLYAYWPQNNSVEIDAIDVDMTAADQTDWLYATPVTDVNEDKASVAVTMNHALANINVKVNKGSYLGAGNITNITLQSDGIALGGTFNAAQTTPGYTAFEDEGKPLSRTVTTTAGATATDIMVVPSGKSAAITFLLTIDGIQFTATSAAVQLAMGNSYQYTLNLSDISTYMEISGFSVKQWTTVTGGALDLTQKETLSWDNVINGVYAVSKEGLPVTMDEADESCIAVALIVNDAPVPQRFMIEKNEILNESWDGDYSFEKGRLGSRGFKCHDAVIPNNDYKSWTNKDSYFSYFDGEIMTAAISYNDYNTKGLLQRFNNNNNNDNAGYNDWYIPEIGQWGLMALYEKDIQLCLEKIGGYKIQEDGQYVTSTGVIGSSTVINWGDDNRFVSDNFWDSYVRVRFIRNIDDVLSSTLNFMVNSYIYQAEENMTWMQFLESSYYMGFYDYDDNYFEGFSFDNENIKIGNDYYLGWMDWEHDEFFKINKNDLIKDGEFYSLDY